MDTNNAIKINDNDNVVVALRNITAGGRVIQRRLRHAPGRVA